MVTPSHQRHMALKNRNTLYFLNFVSPSMQRYFGFFPVLHFFTAHKRSLGQGNVFTPVCYSVRRGVCVADTLAGRHPWVDIPPSKTDTLRQTPPPRQTPLPPKMVNEAGGTHPTGMHSCYNLVIV